MIYPSSKMRRVPPQALLLVTFACFYFAIGPGNFFSIDEAMEEETAQSLILRRTIDIPAMVDARHGRGQSLYTVKGPGLPLVSLPLVYLGLKLDDALGSMNGGQLAGPPVGPAEHPLRWGGRLAISTSLIVNALAGGAIVAVLFMVGAQLSPQPRAAMSMAIAAGLATLVMSEATHFYQHALDALMVLLAFWFFSAKEREDLDGRALFGGLSLGVAMLARPDSVPAAVIIWLYGAAVAWRLVGSLPDRWPRMIRRTVLAGLGPLGGVAGSMYFNWLRFGSVTQFGYTEDRARFVLDLVQIAKGIAGYLISPALSVFLFAPPLILALWVGREAYRRWPLETATLVLAAVAHLLMISSNKTWGGDLSFGPRYMLESIVLLMPLTLPAFERALETGRASLRPRIAVGALVILGFAVQLIGVAVNVAINEWKRTAAGIVNRNEWVFVPSASPVVYDLEELVRGRNLSPWAIRALALPEAPLLLLLVLLAVVCFGGWMIMQYFRTPQPSSPKSRALPIAIVAATVAPIVIGFAMARPVVESPEVQVNQIFDAGLAAQQAGHVVAAEEYYAMVLTFDSSNTYSRFNLGLLEQDAGRTDDAVSLYEAVLRKDPDFTPAKTNMANIIRTHFGFSNLRPQ